MLYSRSLLVIYYFFKLINLFLAVLGLCCCVWAASSCNAWAFHWGDFSYWRAWALGHVGSEVAGHGLSCPLACDSLAPGSGMEPGSPALAGGFLTTGPLGKSLYFKYSSVYM